MIKAGIGSGLKLGFYKKGRAACENEIERIWKASGICRKQDGGKTFFMRRLSNR